MKKFCFLVLIFSAFMFSGCAVSYTIPYKDVPINNADLPSQKIPLKAGIVLPDENFTLTKTYINPGMESNTVTHTVLFGKLMKNASQKIFPAFFEQSVIISGKPYPAGVDIIYTPVIKDFPFSFAGAGAFSQSYKVQLYMKSTVTDINDAHLFTDETTSETQEIYKMGFSEQTFLDDWAGFIGTAVNNALLKAARDMAESREMQVYAQKKSGGHISVSQPDAPPLKDTTKSSPAPKDFESAKAKLKDALEKGEVTAEQLSRALEESRKGARSKILDAFLEDKIDAKKFGELY